MSDARFDYIRNGLMDDESSLSCASRTRFWPPIKVRDKKVDVSVRKTSEGETFILVESGTSQYHVTLSVEGKVRIEKLYLEGFKGENLFPILKMKKLFTER